MINIDKLKTFLKNSSIHTYAGDGKEIAPQRPGFTELEYQEGEWYLRDSYTGHFQAPGMTTVYFKEKPVWTCAYGGKVIKNFYPQTKEIFTFLKKALKRKGLKKAEDIPVRGPSEMIEDKWKYIFDFEGDMRCFYGKEKIFIKNELCFFQDVIGGLVIPKKYKAYGS